MRDIPPVLIDVSRTVSRLGSGAPTGVDRVERAYVRYALENLERPLFLTRVVTGAAILDAPGMRSLLDDTLVLPSIPDIPGRLSQKQDVQRRLAETLVRRTCIGWRPYGLLPSLVRSTVGSEFVYINVGHLHLGPRNLAALRKGGARIIAAMIHDTIPLDHPEFMRDVSVPRFRAMLAALQDHADVLICNSHHTEARARHWLEQTGRVQSIVTAHLGVDRVAIPQPSDTDGHPYFVVLGTIEPRKNHDLLLSTWQDFHARLPADRIPHLHIVGRRGWLNHQVMALLDTAPFMNRTVFERGALNDADTRALVAGAAALLFPSFAEGFGFPMFEALQLGTPVIASDLPPLREVAPVGPVYLDPRDNEGWSRQILEHAKASPGTGRPEFTGHLPTWHDHFECVFDGLRSQVRSDL